MHPWARPSVTRPTTTETWLQSLRIVNANSVSARNTNTNETRAIAAGLNRSYNRDTWVLATKIDNVYGTIDSEVFEPAEPWTTCM